MSSECSICQMGMPPAENVELNAGKGRQRMQPNRKIQKSHGAGAATNQNHQNALGTQAPKGNSTHNRFINRQVTRAAELGDLSNLFQVIRTHMPDMNGINLATAFHRVAKLTPVAKHKATKADPCFVSLLAAITQQLAEHSFLKGTGAATAAILPGEMPVGCMSIVAWSCATLRIRNEHLFENIACVASARLDELQPFELSNLLWAHAKLQLAAPDMFDRASERLMRRKYREFAVQCLSTIVWCFATLQLRNCTLFANLAKELIEIAPNAKPQEISTTLWAYAKNRHHDPELFDALSKVAVSGSKISGFKLQELSNTAWAFATAGIENPQLFAQIERVVLDKIAETEPQSIANISWAFAKLNVQSHSQLLPIMFQTSLTGQRDFKPEELSAVIWAASQMCPDAETFFSAVAEICVNRLGEFSANATANLAKTLADVQIGTPCFYVTILEANMRRLWHLGPQALLNMLEGLEVARRNIAYASVADVIEKKFALVGDHIFARITEFKQCEVLHVSKILSDRHGTSGVEANQGSSVMKKRRSRRTCEKTCLQHAMAEDSTSVGSFDATDSDGDDGFSASLNDFGKSHSKFAPSGQSNRHSLSRHSRTNSGSSSASFNDMSRVSAHAAVSARFDTASPFPHPEPLGLTLSSLARGLNGSNKSSGTAMPTESYCSGAMPWKIPLPAYFQAGTFRLQPGVQSCWAPGADPFLGEPKLLQAPTAEDLVKTQPPGIFHAC